MVVVDVCAAPLELCQWPCSGDQTFPGGASPGGWIATWIGAGSAEVGVGLAAVRVAVESSEVRREIAATAAITTMTRRSNPPPPVALSASADFFSQHCLYFWPEPQGHGSLRPIFALMMKLPNAMRTWG